MIRLIKNPESTEQRLEFTLSGVDVAYANGLRRTIIADIPVVVFRTTPYEQNNCTITKNTSRLNNEIIKQRLSCIPICISNPTDQVMMIEKYILELNVENATDEVLTVTTRDFKIKEIETDNYLSDQATKQIFPPYIDDIHAKEHYIQFVRLRPRISDELLGEKINLTCKFDVGTSKEDSSFNVAGTCTYRRTPDSRAISQELHLKTTELKNKGLTDEEVEFEKKNWQLLDGMRIVVPNSFDFILETVGIYTNEMLIKLACSGMTKQLVDIMELLQRGTIEIEESNNTKPNCFEINYEGYDYTVANIINHEMYTKFFKETSEIHSVSVKKLHPHNTYITMEVSVVNDSNAKNNLLRMLIESCQKGIDTIKFIRKELKKMVPNDQEDQRP
jgi:DNA-directed RNA polymerase alpha subunit/DNA-directed RNA polymerase subunit L